MRSQGVMMFRKVAPMLLVENVDRVVRFYREVLGAKLSASLPESPPFEWASLELGEVELMLWDKEAARKGISRPRDPGEPRELHRLYLRGRHGCPLRTGEGDGRAELGT